MRVDRNRSRFDQVLNNIPQGIATVGRVPYDLMVVAKKVCLMPMRKWIWRQTNLRKSQIWRDLEEDGA